ncbi:phospholipid carrier-dependent glycosyltransferase [Variovorax sp. RT4R15]|uniref:phospholipid carrier-dependent glycosyltransferase n=1 Tax=Variovorax sp. RT4R15 TaxID=3443737 RepID=UPI003F46F168
MPVSQDSRERIPLLLVGVAMVLCLLVWFIGLGTRSLISPDEGRYATLALEMARSGDWVSPRLNGILYFEKPALQYWIGAMAFGALGISEFTARLWPALSGFLTIVLVGATAARLWGRTSGLQAAAVTGSMTWIVGNSHYLTLDAGLTFFLTGALCAFLLASSETGRRGARRWMLAAWIAMAGAVLSKGLVGIVIPGAVLVIVSLWRRRFGLWRPAFWWPSIVLFLVVAAPWFVLASARNPAFAQFFFIHEHFSRFLTDVHKREGAIWYYVPLLLGGMLPWTGALPWIARRVPTGPAPWGIQTRDTLLAWCAFVFVFFSISSSKLPSYILPMFPALALLVVMQLREALSATLRRHLALPAIAWLLIVLASTQASRLASHTTPVEVVAPIASAARLGAAAALAAAALAWWWLGRGRTTLAVLALAFGHALAVILVLNSHDGFGRMKSAEPIAAAVAPLIDVDTPVFAVQSYDQTLPFYFRRDVILVDYRDEFALGQRLEPGRSIDSLDVFEARWRSLPRAVAYMNKATWVALRAHDLPMKTVFEDARRVVVMKP